MFGIESIELQYSTDDAEAVLAELGGALFHQGFVKDTYVDALLKREKIHPTGLPSRGLAIAIPHTDHEHVVQSRIAVATLKEPVPFSMMGNPQLKLPVQIVFMLAIKDPKSQAGILKQLMKLFQNEGLLKEILVAQEKEKVYEVLRENIRLSI